MLFADDRVGGAPKDVIRKWVHVAIQAMYGAYMATSFESVNKRALADVVAKYDCTSCLIVLLRVNTIDFRVFVWLGFTIWI
jgi:hypothetical protein